MGTHIQLFEKLIYCFQNLHLSSHLVRCKCLELIGSLTSGDKIKSEGTESDGGHNFANILGDCTQDVDPRVRTCAFQAMVRVYFKLLSAILWIIYISTG